MKLAIAGLVCMLTGLAVRPCGAWNYGEWFFVGVHVQQWTDGGEAGYASTHCSKGFTPTEESDSTYCEYGSCVDNHETLLSEAFAGLRDPAQQDCYAYIDKKLVAWCGVERPESGGSLKFVYKHRGRFDWEIGGSSSPPNQWFDFVWLTEWGKAPPLYVAWTTNKNGSVSSNTFGANGDGSSGWSTLQYGEPMGSYALPVSYGGGVRAWAGADHNEQGYWNGTTDAWSEEIVWAQYFLPEP
jgi:hypothetical protein